MENAIELSGVSKRFGSNLAVDQLDLHVPRGSIYGFIGPNGSGKTTTLRMILRIFHPDCGVVRVLGQSSGSTADDRLGYLPEERGIYKRMRVRALLTYYAKLKGFFDCQSEIDAWLQRLGAGGWDRKRIDSLSKGMAQKIQFISAVIARPQLVILDEPFSGLDPVNMEVLRDAVLWLREQGTTVVFSTHDMAVAEKICDTIFMIYGGKKVLDGTLASIQNQYQANRVRIGLVDKRVQLKLAEGGRTDAGMVVVVDAARPEVLGLRNVRDVAAVGDFWECELADAGDANRLLKDLVALAELEHFEIIRPTLHEIFVRIAKP